MKILFFIITLPIIIGLFIMSDNSIIKSKLSKGQLKILLAFVTIAFSLWGLFFTWKGSASIDLLRHFQELENFRVYGFDYFLESGYKELFVINIFVYLVSLTPFNNLFIAIPIFIDLLIMSYICFSIFSEFDEISLSDVLITLVCFFVLFNIKFLLTAVRTNLVMSICALAFYFEYIKKTKKCISVMLYIIAIFIHPFALIIVMMRCILIFAKNPKTLFILVPITILIVVVSLPLLSLINNEYLQYTIKKLMTYLNIFSLFSVYQSQSFMTGTLTLMMVLIPPIISLCIMNPVVCKNTFDSQLLGDRKYVRMSTLFVLTSIASLCLCFNYLLIERFSIFTAYVYLMYMPYFLKKHKYGLGRIIVVTIMIFLLFWSINDVYAIITGEYVFAGIFS